MVEATLKPGGGGIIDMALAARGDFFAVSGVLSTRADGAGTVFFTEGAGALALGEADLAAVVTVFEAGFAELGFLTGSGFLTAGDFLAATAFFTAATFLAGTFFAVGMTFLAGVAFLAGVTFLAAGFLATTVFFTATAFLAGAFTTLALV